MLHTHTHTHNKAEKVQKKRNLLLQGRILPRDYLVTVTLHNAKLL